MAGLRYALRSLRRRAGSAAVVILTLAVSIGATTIIVSLVEFLFHAIPATDTSRLTLVSSTDPRPNQAQSGMYGGLALSGTSVPDLVDWASRVRTIDQFVAYRYDSATLREQNVPERVRVVRTTANLPAVFGLTPAAGRLFRADEGQRGAARVALMSERFWRQRYASNPQVVGSSLLLDGAPHAIAGVLTAAAGRGIFMDVDLYVATPLDAARSARDDRPLFVFGLLHPGATIEQASAELSSVAADLRRAYPATNAQTGAIVRPLIEQLGGNIMQVIAILLLIAALIVATACANVSNVMLALGTARQRELSIRSALGAHRLEHVRRLMLEASVLAVAAGGLGLAIGSAGLSALKWFGGAQARLLAGAEINGWVVAAGVVVSFLLPLAFGLLPAVTVSRPDVAELTDGARHTRVGSRRLRTALVAVQAALAVVLMVQIAIMGLAARRISHAPLGFDPSRTLTFTMELPAPQAANADQLARLQQPLLDQIDSVPGVTSSSITSRIPFGDREQVVPVTVDGAAATRPADMPTTAIAAAGLRYFSTLRVPVEEGRVFSDTDVAGGAPPVVISREAARRFWPEGNAVGRTLTVRADGWPSTPLRVIGVVQDVRPAAADTRIGPQIYVPWSWHPERRMRFVVRSAAADPASLVPAIRSRLAAIQPDDPIFQVLSMDEVLYGDTASEYILSILTMAIALIALAVAAVGIYGLVAQDVTRRTREIGVRLALGAQPAAVVRMVVGDGTRPVLYGGLVGLVAATALAFATAASVMGNAKEPLAYAGVVAALSLTALAATYLPARRASRIDPVNALRAE